MKKLLLLLASAAFIVSCNKLAENEYEIEGKIDPSLNGKQVYLEKLGGYMGFTPVDTVKVEDGKFVFKGTVTDPSLHFISYEGAPMAKVNIILEPGEIAVDVNKDSIQNSKMGGTFNNDMLFDYSQDMKKLQKTQVKKDEAFRAKYANEIKQAMTTNDTAIMSRLNKLYLAENKEATEQPLNFLKKNPKAHINIYILRDAISKQSLSTAEAKKIFDGLDEKVRNSKEGKELLEKITGTGKPAAEAAKTDAPAGPAVGSVAPAFSAPSPEGKAVSLKESMGKVTVIDFWASWCKPCRAENPNVVAMYNELHPKGLNIIGISLDKDAAKWKEAIAADKLTWNHVSNLKFWEEPIAAQYSVTSIPATFVLDADGKIVARDLRGDALKAKVEELLNKK